MESTPPPPPRASVVFGVCHDLQARSQDLSSSHSPPLSFLPRAAESRLVLLAAGGWTRGPSRGTGGSGDENVAPGDGKRRDL